MATQTQIRVLVIDDEQSWREIVSLRLKQLYPDCVIDMADNALDAQELIDTTKYDLIVSDNNMQVGNEGVSLLLTMRSLSVSLINKDTPFILHTSDDSDTTQKRVREYGGTFCYKQGKELPSVLREALMPKKAKAA